MNLPFQWDGKEIKNNGDIFDIMKNSVPDKAKEFTEVLRNRFGKTDADSLIFRGTFLEMKTAKDCAGMLSKMLGGDYSGEFYVTEAPQDELGNTANSECVMKVKIVDQDGSVNLQVLSSAEITSRSEDSIYPRAFRYLPVDGPDRKLSREDWQELVGFKPSK